MSSLLNAFIISKASDYVTECIFEWCLENEIDEQEAIEQVVSAVRNEVETRFR